MSATFTPTESPSLYPTLQPTDEPTFRPTRLPTLLPSRLPTARPSNPTYTPNATPRPTRSTKPPTVNPTETPTVAPTESPTDSPTVAPTELPTSIPYVAVKVTQPVNGISCSDYTANKESYDSKFLASVMALYPGVDSSYITLDVTCITTSVVFHAQAVDLSLGYAVVVPVNIISYETLVSNAQDTSTLTAALSDQGFTGASVDAPAVENLSPTRAPTTPPTLRPTRAPTQTPTKKPTRLPTIPPTEAPTNPTAIPTMVSLQISCHSCPNSHFRLLIQMMTVIMFFPVEKSLLRLFSLLLALDCLFSSSTGFF